MPLIIFLSLLPGCNNQSEKQTKPIILTDNDIANITIKTTLSFARAVNAGDLNLFRDTTADEFKQNFSAQQFTKAFDGFIKQKINMVAISNFPPLFEQPPRITENGNLAVQGYFPTKPSRVRFNYTYKLDPIQWKIISIDINVAP